MDSIGCWESRFVTSSVKTWGFSINLCYNNARFWLALGNVEFIAKMDGSIEGHYFVVQGSFKDLR